jgi:hypothetical protein
MENNRADWLTEPASRLYDFLPPFCFALAYPDSVVNLITRQAFCPGTMDTQYAVRRPSVAVGLPHYPKYPTFSHRFQGESGEIRLAGEKYVFSPILKLDVAVRLAS